MASVVVFGGYGRLGRALQRWSQHEIHAVSSKECDIRDRRAVLASLERLEPEVAINCAALTNAAFCEAHPLAATSVNVKGAFAFADACRNQNVFSVQISSNAVLDPVNVYARSKKAAELSGADVQLRTSFYDESHWLIAELRAGRTVRLFTHNAFNPISSIGLVGTLDKVMEGRLRGTLEVGTAQAVSYYSFGLALARRLGVDMALLEPVSHLEPLVPFPVRAFLTDAFRWSGGPAPDLEADLDLFFSWAQERDGRRR